MATYELNLREFLVLVQKHPHLLRSVGAGEYLAPGTVVVCSTKKDFEQVQELGSIRYHGAPVQLAKIKGKEHPDGKYGEAFVQPWNKSKKIAESKFAGNSYLCIFIFSL